MNIRNSKIDKISVISYVLSFLIVWVHNGPAISNISLYGTAGQILMLFDTKLHQILTFVVPLYFMISGFLFFSNCTWKRMKEKLISRVYSLGVPFVIWNIVSYYTIVLAVKFNILESNVLSGGIINAIINSSCSDLWFIRYLMILVVISPILFLVMRTKLGAWGLLGGVILIKFIFGTSIPVFPSFYLPIYVFGGIMAIHYRTLFLAPSEKCKSVAFVGSAVVMLYGLLTDFKNGIFAMSLYGLLMPPFFWFGIEWIMDKFELKYRARSWMSTNFFIYINHFNIMKIVIAVITAHELSLGYILAWYIFLPEFVFVSLLLIGAFWKRCFPKSWKIVNGGR